MKKMIFIALMVAALTAVARAGLYSYWNFDEGSGTIAHDSTGHNNGTLVNGPAWTTGKIGGALSFDGINDYVVFSSITVSTNNATIALWFNTSSDFSGNYSQQGNLISEFGWYIDYLAVVNEGDARYAIVGETNAQDDYFVYVKDVALKDKWNHVAVSFDNKVAKTYLNGNLIDTRSVTDNLYIRSIGGPPSESFSGKIDDVRIYDNALSQNDIRAIMPEPATLFLLGLGGLALLRNRRK